MPFPPPAPLQCPTCRKQFSGDGQFCPDDGSQLVRGKREPTDTYLGQQILGHIEIKELSGVGAMGRVYRGFQQGIDRDVAVKILHRELGSNPELVSRFHREAKVASRLVHPNVVHVHLSGQLPDGALYIVMEYLNGLSLQGALTQAGETFPLARALHVALQICDALGEAHVEGVIHRDLKPDNVMLVRRGDDPDFVKVLDFGIAHLSWSDPSMATAAGLIFGTARYISPEGAQGGPVGPASDVYSVATLLYQMFAGATPFEGEQAVGLLVQHIHSPPPPLLSRPRAKAVPAPIADLIMANLAKTPSERAADGHTFGRQLVAAARTSGLDIDGIMGHPRLSRGAGTTPSSPDVGLTPSPAGRALPRTAFGPIASPSSAPKVPSTARSAMFDAALTPPRTTRVVAAPPSFPETTPPATSSAATTVYQPDPAWQAAEPSQDEQDGALNERLSRTYLEENAGLPRRHGRTVGIVLACFVVGVAGAGVLAYRFQQPQTVPAGPSLEVETARATDALLHQRWDEPKGDNVRDLTDEGLRRFPGAASLLRVRELACDDIVHAARAKQSAGEPEEASRLAHLAFELDPKDEEARLLVAPPTLRAVDAGRPHGTGFHNPPTVHPAASVATPGSPAPSASSPPHPAPSAPSGHPSGQPSAAPSSQPPASTSKWL